MPLYPRALPNRAYSPRTVIPGNRSLALLGAIGMADEIERELARLLSPICVRQFELIAEILS